jgi:hypothetical protein
MIPANYFFLLTAITIITGISGAIIILSASYSKRKSNPIGPALNGFGSNYAEIIDLFKTNGGIVGRSEGLNSILIKINNNHECVVFKLSSINNSLLVKWHMNDGRGEKHQLDWNFNNNHDLKEVYNRITTDIEIYLENHSLEGINAYTAY